MASETDEQFLDRLEATPRYNPAYRTLDSDRLFALARRGADAADRIEQLEAALRKITDRLEEDFNDGRPMRRYELEKARAALEERT